MKNILVTGGAGYIGSFMTKRLLDEGHTVTVIDTLERGHKEAVDTRATLEVGNILDKQFLSTVFAKSQFDAVIHFAGYISVGESVEHPDEYFRNNTFGSLCLLEQMKVSDVKNIIFSSTAGIYGNPTVIPIPEDHTKQPVSPYGESKLLVEHGLSWYQKTFGINFIALRYFNASGAALDGSMGENHTIESHIIPNIIRALQENKPFTLFGDNYDTKDGSCVRDYIHVLDLVEAHLLALKKLESDGGQDYYNVGTGKGYSNREVIDAVKRISGKEIAVEVKERRDGDPATLIADNSRIKNELGFAPRYSDIDTIVTSALKWQTQNEQKNEK